MSAKEPGPHWLWVEEPSGSEARVNITNGALVTCKLEVKLPDVVFKTSDPAHLLRMVVVSFLLALADKLCKFLNEVPNFCHAGVGECRVDHADDGGGEGARVVVSPGRSVQQELLGGGGGFGRLGRSLRGVDNFFGGGIKVGISGAVGG